MHSMTLSLVVFLAFGAFALPPAPSRSEDVPSGRSYGGNSYVVSSQALVSDSQPSYSNSYATRNTGDYDNRYTKSYSNDYSTIVNNDYGSSGVSNSGYSSSSYSKYPSSYSTVQDRFHPTTYEEDSHTGEVVLPAAQDSRPAASQDSVVSASSQSDLQDSFLQSTGSFGPEPAVQSSEPVGVQVDPALPPPAQDQNYDYPQPSPPPLPAGYDYHPPPPPPPPPATPPPAPTPYYYYPPPAPPSNMYLPVPTPSNLYLPLPTPPPPPPEEERQVDYTYYYLGPKLWYIPLLFSIYFVLYVGALIVKAVSKHKVLFPQQLFNAASSVYTGRTGEPLPLDQLTAKITQALSSAALRYIRRRVHAKD